MKIIAVIITLTIMSVTSAWSAPFFGHLVLQGVTFQVESPNDRSINLVTIRATTIERQLGQLKVEAEGTIANMEIADLNADGYPEVYIHINSAGSGSYGSLIAYSSNRNLSISEIYLPPLENNSKFSDGYMGHDSFAVGEGKLLRCFPLYGDGDTNAEPTGGMRQIQYKLEAGEAGWILRPFRVYDF